MRPAYETAQLTLARLPVDTVAAREQVLEEIGRIGARTLALERVSVWFYGVDRRHLHCEMVFLRSRNGPGGWDGVPVLAATDHPAYFAALEERRAIAAPDASTHPATRELAATYLGRIGITSMLDAPLYVGGVVVGVVCHEHVGARRDWTQADVDFATSVADLASAALSQLEWRSCQQVLHHRAARLREADRLLSLEHVVRAFIHDFNNVLNVVTLSAASLGRGMAPAAEIAAEIEEGAGMAVRLVEQLKAFVDRDPAASGRAPLGAILGCLQPVLGLLLRDRAQLTVDVDEPASKIWVARTRVEQVVFNLCINARDAIAGHGTIAIRARVADHPRSEAVIIEVEDSGSGMSAETAARVFEPYFTTKPDGTGLGLATCRELVEEAGGKIEVRTRLGAGSVFSVLLPSAEATSL